MLDDRRIEPSIRSDKPAGAVMPARRRRRGQSSVISVVLVIGLVVVGTGAVLLIGSQALEDMQDQASASQAELAMSSVDSQVSEIALGYASSRRVSLGGQGRATLNESAGRITIERVGENATGPPLVNTTMGSIEYRSGGTVVAYQGGGVWRSDGGRARMITPPEFHYQHAGGDPTLTFPLVVLRGSASGNTLTFTDGATRTAFPDPSEGRRNPMDAGTVRVTIRSEYYRGWVTYFEERTDAETVTVTPANRTVTVVLSVPTRGRAIQHSIASRSPTVTVRGGATVDSYNSSEGTYEDTQGENGDVYVGQDLANAGGGTIYGDMYVDGDFQGGGGTDVEGRLIADGDADLTGGGVSVDEEIIADGDLILGGGGSLDSPVIVSGSVTENGGGVSVDGDVVAGGDYVSSSGGEIESDVHVGGDFHSAAGKELDGEITAAGEFIGGGEDDGEDVVENGPEPDLSGLAPAENLQPPNMQSIDGTIDAKVTAAAATNDNAGTDASRVESGDCDGSGCTLTNGTYHINDLTLSGDDHLTFDTTGGPVYVAVDGDVSTSGTPSVSVTGPNEVHIYARGDYTIQSDWESVGDRGDQIWLYGTSGSTVTIDNGATFYGVVYAPNNQDITVRGGAEVYGGIVGSVSTIQGGTALHYDTALSGEPPVLVGGGNAPVTFLHVTVNEVHVEER